MSAVDNNCNNNNNSQKQCLPKPIKNNYYTQIGYYDIIRTIGHGNFAVCKLAQHRLTKTIVAIKFIDKTNLDATHLSRIYKEIEIMKETNHKNIIKLYQVMESNSMLYLVCEYATNGELYEYILRNGAMNEKLACEKFHQIVNAVDYCHKKNIVHRDLKSENLLLDSNLNIKLADFGFANYYDMINPLKTFCGSAPYAAPEVFCGQKYFGPEIDVWSLGVILYVLVTGTLPFNSDTIQQLKQRVLACKYVLPSYLSSECVDLIQKILVVNSNERITLEQIKQHNWFKVNNISFNNLNGTTLRDKFMEGRVNNETFSISTSYDSIADGNINVNNNIQKDDGFDKNVINLMKSCGFDAIETVNSLNQNRFNNNTAIYSFLIEKKLIDNLMNDKLIKQHPQQNESTDIILNTNLIKRKDLLKTIKNQYNKLHKNFISNSSSIDEGVESDFSSPTQSFSNDFLSSITVNSQLLFKQQHQHQQPPSQNQQQQQQPSTSTLASMSSPPLTPPLQARKTRTQTSNRSMGSIGNKTKYIVNNTYSSNGCINTKKSSFNPLDLSQIKRELTKLIKINSIETSKSNNVNITTNATNVNNNQKKQESHKNKQSLMNDKTIENTNNVDNSSDHLKSSKSWDNLAENEKYYDKFNRKCSLK